jgi:hypothetical protein
VAIIKIVFSTTTMLLLFLLVGTKCGAACPDMKGLFEEHQRFIADFGGHQEGYYYPSPTTGTKPFYVLKKMDDKYLYEIGAILNSDETGEILDSSVKVEERACSVCKSDLVTHDEYLKIACGLARFRENHDSASFVKTIPWTQLEIYSLWQFDSLVASVPEYYEEAVYDCASEGNKRAVLALYRFAPSADGEYAEYLCDLIAKLFGEHLDVMIKYWPDIVNERGDSFDLGTSDFAKYADKTLARLRYLHRKGKVSDDAFRQIRDYLKQQQSNSSR